MFDLSVVRNDSKVAMYEDMGDFITGLFYKESDCIANMSNLASLLYHSLPDLNWAGFYLYKSGQLVLGPFQGKPACIRIEIGRGVCGRVAKEQKTMVVKNVHEYPGHIACDGDTNAEMVLPIIKDGYFLGVLDLDSPVIDRFDNEDQVALERIVLELVKASDFTSIIEQ